MGFRNTVEWEGRTVLLGDLEEFCRRARENGCLIDTEVSVHKAPEYSNPTDPGGEITIRVRSSK